MGVGLGALFFGGGMPLDSLEGFGRHIAARVRFANTP